MARLLDRIRCDPHDSEIVYLELERAYRELLRSRRQPAKYRRSFEEYVGKTQQLTEVMRVEYKRNTGKPWAARLFSGWTPQTEALKAIRRATFHQMPLLLDTVEIGVYPREAVERMFPGSGHHRTERHRNSPYGIIKGTSFVERPFARRIITSGMGIPKRSGRPQSAGDFWFPLKTFVGYEISHRLVDEDLQKALSKAGTRDAGVLALRTFPVYKRYFLAYVAKLRSDSFL